MELGMAHVMTGQRQRARTRWWLPRSTCASAGSSGQAGFVLPWLALLLGLTLLCFVGVVGLRTSPPRAFFTGRRHLAIVGMVRIPELVNISCTKEDLQP